jgi:ubiquinone/menaquinone biosynthesis C-methylase UbiE
LNRFFRKPSKPQYFQVEAYQNWLEKDGEDLYEHFYSKHASFSGKCVLDLACGHGGKAAVYGRKDPEFICGIDLNTAVIREAKDHLKELKISAEFAGADAEGLPFQDSTFDLVISDDGFDHFKRPGKVLDEIARVLKHDGAALISFTPYYVTDCSHMREYLQVPWHHVFFSRNALRQALNLVASYEAQQGSGDPSAYRSGVDGVFDTFINHLSRLSFRGFKTELSGRRGLKLVRLRRQSWDWARPLTYLPVLNELFVNRVFCVVRKDGSSEIDGFDLARQVGMDVRQDFRATVGRIGSLFGRISLTRRVAAGPGSRNH